jgi:hypothetical protein
VTAEAGTVSDERPDARRRLPDARMRSPDARQRLRAKNVALGAVLAGIVVLFYLLGMFRFGGGTP